MNWTTLSRCTKCHGPSKVVVYHPVWRLCEECFERATCVDCGKKLSRVVIVDRGMVCPECYEAERRLKVTP